MGTATLRMMDWSSSGVYFELGNGGGERWRIVDRIGSRSGEKVMGNERKKKKRRGSCLEVKLSPQVCRSEISGRALSLFHTVTAYGATRKWRDRRGTLTDAL